MKPYEGKEGFVFISYSHRDSETVIPVIERLLTEGYRVWYDEGITPGTEWDENIAKHMEDCNGVVAFLSDSYLGSENCKDELNYARDLEKNRLLIYLEEVNLPSGMAMRLNRSQAILHYRYENAEDFFEELTRAPMICGVAPEEEEAEEKPAAEDNAETKAEAETAAEEGNIAETDTPAGEEAEETKPVSTVGEYVLENCVVENAEPISKTESVTAVMRVENVPTDEAGNVLPVPAAPAKKKGVPTAVIAAAAVLAVILLAFFVILPVIGKKTVIKPETAADVDVDWDGGDWTDRNDILPIETEEGYIVFGAYEQDGKENNGPEPIEWELLEKDDEHMLLVSRYILDCQPYNEDDEDVTWEDCSLREWLNDDFIDQAFTKEEQELIESTSLKNPDNEYWDTPGGDKTKDKVFCLGLDDLLSYYDLDEWYGESDCNTRWGEDNVGYCERLIIVPTEYAIDEGVYCEGITRDDYIGAYYDDWDGLEEEGYSRDCIGLEGAYWWLRTPGLFNSNACYVCYDGYMGWGTSMTVDMESYGVRPALYVSRR